MKIIKRFAAYVDSWLETTSPKPMDLSSLEDCTCRNCGTVFKGNYCPCCSQSAKTRRFVLKNIPETIISALANTERGIFRTIIELFWRPGYMMRDYIEGHRATYTRPLQLLFVTTSLYVIVRYILFYHSGIDVEEETVSLTEHGALMNFVLEIISNLTKDRAALSLASVLLLIFPLFITFRNTDIGKKTNLAELFFVLVYVAAQSMILNILSLPYDRFVGKESETSLGFPFLVMLIDLRQYYGITMRSTFLRLVLSYILVFAILVVVVLGVILISDATKVSADFEAMLY